MPTGKLWASFRTPEGGEGFGLFVDGAIAEHDGGLFDAPQATGRRFARDSVEWLAPCCPTKVIALWNNFGELGAKLGKAPPSHPLFLIKPSTSVVGPGAAIVRPKSYAGKIAFEGELAIVIGRACKDVDEERAADYIFGYTCVNDVTAAELLDENPDFAQWCRAKSFDSFACLGPVIATAFDYRNARVKTLVGGALRQDYPLADMIMSPARVVSRVSRDMTLLPGDVIACGTSVGVGSIKDGATVEVVIDGIGSLINVLAPATVVGAPAA